MIYLILASLTFAVDRLSKHLVYVHKDKLLLELPLVKNFISLYYVENTGIAFGLFSKSFYFTILFPLFLIILFVFLAIKKGTKTQKILTSIIGGAFLSNLFDRFFHHYVIDMIIFPFLPYFVCNIADVFIVICTIILSINILLSKG